MRSKQIQGTDIDRISPKFIRLINHMYKNLKSKVKTNDVISDSFPISIGIRQGCNLSPHLFNLYVNDIPNIY